MKKYFGSLKIGALLGVIIGIGFAVAAAITIALVHYSMHQQALAEAEVKVGLMLDRNLAIHAYFSQSLKPNLFKWTEPFRSSDYFDPAWMSSSYAVREMGKYFKAISTADYYYKDASINARSPENEADADERAFLLDLKTDPSLKQRSSVRTINGQPYLVVLRSGEVLEQSCMQCHGDPQDAPGDLVRIYGPDRSFHREAEIGSVISALSIRVPLAVAYAEADRVSIQLSVLLLTLLGLLFILLLWLPRRLVFSPLASMRDKAIQISTHEEHLGEQIPAPFGEELGTLTSAFNTMSVNLRESRDHLEARILERTSVLNRANHELDLEITERKQIEATLQKSEERYHLLFDNMTEGFALHELVFDENGDPCDYRFLDINHAFEKLTGLQRENLVGRTQREALPGEDPFWFKTYSKVALTGEAIRLEHFSSPLQRHYQVYAYSPAKNQFAVIFSDITERKQAEAALCASHAELEQRVLERTAELQAANFELEKAARTKDEFLAAMSHELRTPLIGIIGLSEAMQKPDQDLLTEKQGAYLTHIHDSGQRLLELLNDIIDLSRLDARKFALNPAPCPLSQICQSSLQLIAAQAVAKDLQYSFSMTPEPLLLKADSLRLKQILANLLSNAIKFTPRGGSFGILVVGSQVEKQVRLTVWDTGIGIQAEDQARLFQPFVQLDARLAREYSGTGLGLVLVKHLAELHGASVEVESTFGQGSRFTVVLPWNLDESQ